jgi:hypothetical protein
MSRVAGSFLAACVLGLLANGAVPADAAPRAQIVPCVEHHRITPQEAGGTPVAGNDAQHRSQVGVAVATDLPPGTQVKEQLQGGGRNLSLMGPVAADHTFFGRFGIDQFAVYTLIVSNSSELARTTFTVGPQEQSCAGAIAAAQKFAVQQPSAGPTATAAEPKAAENPPVSTASTSTSNWLWLILVVIGILAALAGLMLWRPWTPVAEGHPHTQEKPPTPHTEERPPPPPSGGHTIAGGTPPTMQKPVCDWAVYFDEGGILVCLRAATGHECCRYIISVASSLLGRFETRGRQGPDHVGDWSGPHGERLRIPDLGARWDGLESWSWAGARSGPRGTLNWMQGYGELPHGEAPPGPATLPAKDADDPAVGLVNPGATLTPVGHQPYHQPPDVLAQMAFLESTLVRVRLENHCTKHVNTYSGVAESTVHVQATDECTNSAPGPHCPVKLTAVGWVAARVVGRLNYTAQRIVRKFADQDRPEWLNEGPDVPPLLGAEESLPSYGGSLDDSHDHGNPPRRVYQSQILGKDARAVQTDTYRVRLSDYAELYAGAVVPVEVWPTTDRVTAAIWSHVRHALKVVGTDNVQCDGTCCAHPGTCRCAPEFELFLGPGKGLIRTDGKECAVQRPNGQKPDGLDSSWLVDA